MQTVLLLDDNVDTVELLKAQLEDAGFRVVAFNSCLEALEFVSESPRAFDCVLSDLHMPDASGMDLLAAVREIDAVTPFLIMTAQSDFDEGAVFEQGGQGVLYKPLNKDGLINRIRAALREFRER